jgi:hypothetical protein
MADPISEYTVRDFSAVDKQIEQIAERERIVTQRLKLANVRRAVILGVAALMAIGLFLILAAWAYRIAFPPEPTVVETTKIVEKIIQPPKIVIQTPEGSRVVQTRDSTTTSQNQTSIQTLGEEDAQEAVQDIEQRLKNAGVNNSGSNISASLSWNNFNDLDLIIKEPNGNLVFFKKKRSETNGILDVDANANDNPTRTRKPIENIRWPAGEAPKGEYIVSVMFYRKSPDEPSTGSTPFTVRLVHDGQSMVRQGKFSNDTPPQTLIEIARLNVE